MENDKLSLSTPINDLEKQLKEAQDGDSLQKVVDLFNLNIKKKDIIRAGQLSELQDKISQQMADRVNNHAGEFSNKDLLDYFKVIIAHYYKKFKYFYKIIEKSIDNDIIL